MRATDTLSHTLIFDLRLPRTLTAFAAGGVLALAGVLMQVLLRNPLADPFIMGVSGGAAVAALAAMLLGTERAADRRERDSRCSRHDRPGLCARPRTKVVGLPRDCC